jgi:hypothetical protein
VLEELVEVVPERVDDRPLELVGWRGISRSDVKELGDLIDAGEAALLVVGASNLEEALDKAALKAEKHIAKQLDVSTKDVDAAVKEAAGQVG